MQRTGFSFVQRTGLQPVQRIALRPCSAQTAVPCNAAPSLACSASCLCFILVAHVAGYFRPAPANMARTLLRRMQYMWLPPLQRTYVLAVHLFTRQHFAKLRGTHLTFSK